jgi:hypothetical protein
MNIRSFLSKLLRQKEEKMAEKIDSPIPAKAAKTAEMLNSPVGAAAVNSTELANSAFTANERLDRLDSSLKSAIASYRALVIRANPDVLPEFISGESIEALDASLARAKDLIGKVRSGLETRAAAAAAAMRVPSGAPQRGAVDAAAAAAAAAGSAGSLSPRDKISLGVEKIRK